jgi:catechol 2,3-dioxygenase-like lactoylglutathione lyase family enzyme
VEAVSHIRQFDHVGITVADLDSVTAFFTDLGLEVEGRTFVEGDVIDTVIGIPGSRTEIVMLRPPDGPSTAWLRTDMDRPLACVTPPRAGPRISRCQQESLLGGHHAPSRSLR